MGERVEREGFVATGFRTGNPKPQSSTAVIVRISLGGYPLTGRLFQVAGTHPTPLLMVQWTRRESTEFEMKVRFLLGGLPGGFFGTCPTPL